MVKEHTATCAKESDESIYHIQIEVANKKWDRVSCNFSTTGKREGGMLQVMKNLKSQADNCAHVAHRHSFSVVRILLGKLIEKGEQVDSSKWYESEGVRFRICEKTADDIYNNSKTYPVKH